MTERVTGIGGIFFKAKDPVALSQWYKKHLGIPAENWGAMFDLKKVAEKMPGAYQLWSPFKEDTKYIEPSVKPFMFNFMVADLASLLDVLKEEGVNVLGMEESEFGKFAWIMDPEQNKIELWQPNQQ